MAELVQFYADKPAPSAPDLWPWQTYLAYRLRSLITVALAIAGAVSAVYVFRWLMAWTDAPFAVGLTALLVSLMPARHYFARTHPALGKWAFGLWAAVLAFALISAAMMTTPRPQITPESPAGIEHEQELLNAMSYPPRYRVEAMRSYAIQFCPAYERWWTYVFPVPNFRACWDARKFEVWLAEIDRYKANDRKLAQWERNPQAPLVSSWWPGWAYLGHEAHMLPMRILIVLVAAVAFWGVVEMQNVMLAEKYGQAGVAGSVAPSNGPARPPSPSSKTETERAFEAWATDYLVRDPHTDTPTELLSLAYHLSCLAEDRPAYNEEAFGRKLASWAREKLKTFERLNAKKAPVYVGLTLKDGAITQEARRSFENGA